jgi:hypothetical protein
LDNHRDSFDLEDADWGINRRQLAEEEANGQDVLQLQERGVQELHNVAAELDLTLHQVCGGEWGRDAGLVCVARGEG